MGRPEKHAECRRSDPWGVRNLAESRCDNEPSLRELFELDHVTGLASFSCEDMPARHVAVLRVSFDRHYRQSERPQASADVSGVPQPLLLCAKCSAQKDLSMRCLIPGRG